MVDGCSEYRPKNPNTDPLCAACGCHRNYHRKVTIIDLEKTEARGNYSPGGQNMITPKGRETEPAGRSAGGYEEAQIQIHRQACRPDASFFRDAGVVVEGLHARR
ncbi:uncharacterized protein J3R85_020229 [Psidium guajava]|nr:uncharacterized protein J3R85_020229 [Psidium guajava]